MIKEGLQAKQIAAPAKAADLPDTHGGNHRGVAKLLAGVNIAQVDFHRRQLDRRDSVAQRIRIMCKGARIDENPIGPFARVVDRVDQRSTRSGPVPASTASA